jgi:hypothetical protein
MTTPADLWNHIFLNVLPPAAGGILAAMSPKGVMAMHPEEQKQIPMQTAIFAVATAKAVATLAVGQMMAPSAGTVAPAASNAARQAEDARVFDQAYRMAQSEAANLPAVAGPKVDPVSVNPIVTPVGGGAQMPPQAASVALRSNMTPEDQLAMLEGRMQAPQPQVTGAPPHVQRA